MLYFSTEVKAWPRLFKVHVAEQLVVVEGGTGQLHPVCGIRGAVREGEIPLREVQVGLVRPDEVPRWNALLREHHYLGFRKMCGRRLRHLAVWRERWLALHCAARDRWIGWTSLQRRTRLFLVANNTRYLLLPGFAGTPRLASRVLGRSLRRLARDWQALHGHALLLAETFVDPARFILSTVLRSPSRNSGLSLAWSATRCATSISKARTLASKLGL